DRLERVGETAERARNMGAFANQFEAHERSHSSSEAWALRPLLVGKRRPARLAGSPVGEYERAGHQEEMNDDQTCSVPKRTIVSRPRCVVRSLPRARAEGRWLDQAPAEERAFGERAETSQTLRR